MCTFSPLWSICHPLAFQIKRLDFDNGSRAYAHQYTKELTYFLPTTLGQRNQFSSELIPVLQERH